VGAGSAIRLPAFACKRRVVKKRDEADNKNIGFIPLVVLIHATVTVVTMAQQFADSFL